MQELQTKAITLDSREVAQMMKKRHDHLVRDIQKYSGYLTAPNFGVSDFFIKSTYKDSTGRTLVCYQITKKGCELIAHKMTGEKGTQFSALYINRFHEMEQQLKQPCYVQQHIDEPYTYKDKYWQGKQVVTLMDIEQLTGCPRHSVLYYIKHTQGFRSGVDYYFLEGADLREFKRQNGYNKYANSLWLLTESGCRKLAKGFSEVKRKLPSFAKKCELKAAENKTVTGIKLTSLSSFQYILKRMDYNLRQAKDYKELLGKPISRDVFKGMQHFLKVISEDLNDCMQFILNMDITEDLEVLFY